MRVISKTTVPRSAGFTMIEVLVALIILAIGLLGVAGMQALSLKQTSNSNIRSLVTMHAYDLSERMRSEFSDVTTFEKALSAECTDCNSDLAAWHGLLVSDVPTAASEVDVTTTANSTFAEITVNWTERGIGNDAIAQNYTLYVRLR
ncbi:type IV pilus modification protein PilV [Marinobacter sp. M-5]|jgi:type IV pilus assembly protein PilV|uniref:type IV pilus modification protein PilV n=1 Tax=Marinobacter sp. M-5 TaxID=3081089 RepID=UPI00293D13A4|nr:type IV pilus modification protein PilV [Marinobacter sp. M-5]MDV3505350.1 type IV pilus modification protein PilV [Marinobacter sp. M-5]